MDVLCVGIFIGGFFCASIDEMYYTCKVKSCSILFELTDIISATFLVHKGVLIPVIRSMHQQGRRSRGFRDVHGRPWCRTVNGVGM